MKIEKCFDVAAPHDEVWRFITSPQQVGTCVPGCEEVELIGEDQYKATLKVQVGPIKTSFKVDVEATEQRAPQFAAYVTKGEEGGRASRINATSTLLLKPLDATRTEVTYASDISIVGRLGKFGAGIMKKKADSIGDEFVTALKEQLEGPAIDQKADVSEIPADGWFSRMHRYLSKLLCRFGSRSTRKTGEHP